MEKVVNSCIMAPINRWYWIGVVSCIINANLIPAKRTSKRLGHIDFQCPERDQSTDAMRQDANSNDCCCRIRCNGACPEAEVACRAELACVGVQRSPGWATLKALPQWWDHAPGVRRCKNLDEAFSKSPMAVLRKDWQEYHCDDYVHGDRLVVNRTGKLVFDIGFHSGEDTLSFLELGHDVVAIDANPVVLRDGMSRPAMRIAEKEGRLHSHAQGIVSFASNVSLTFYVHRRVSEWSTFNKPHEAHASEFDRILVSVTTCKDLIHQHGVPHYLKVDIEGLDKACIGSLEPRFLPACVSTEDPLQLDHLLLLGYRLFKMVSQRKARRGGSSSLVVCQKTLLVRGSAQIKSVRINSIPASICMSTLMHMATEFVRNMIYMPSCRCIESNDSGAEPRIWRWMNFSEIQILLVDVPGPKVVRMSRGAEPRIRRWTFSEIQILFVDVPGPKVLCKRVSCISLPVVQKAIRDFFALAGSDYIIQSVLQGGRLGGWSSFSYMASAIGNINMITCVQHGTRLSLARKYCRCDLSRIKSCIFEIRSEKK